MDMSDYPTTKQVFFKTAVDALQQLDIRFACERTGAEYDAASGQYYLNFLGSAAQIDAQNGSMRWAWPVPWLFHITALHYLIYADGSKPKGELIGMHDAAPLGSTRVNQMKQSCVPPLIELFANDMDAFFASAQRLDGEKLSNNEVKLWVFPHIPVQIKIYAADDEFPADAQILFDKTLRWQLPAEGIVYVGDIAVQGLAMASGKPYAFPA